MSDGHPEQEGRRGSAEAEDIAQAAVVRRDAEVPTERTDAATIVRHEEQVTPSTFSEQLGAVRVRKEIREEPTTAGVAVARTSVVIERRPADRPAPEHIAPYEKDAPRTCPPPISSR